MRKAVICFTRVPKPGQTKTRLLPVLSGEQCADLHRAFLRDLNDVYMKIEGALLVAYTPDPQWEMLRELLPAAKHFFPQQGIDLGEKMHDAFCHAFSLGYSHVLLTGSDLPELTPDVLEKAFYALQSADVVVGPTSDGGYFLIGMKAPCEAAFRGHQYGSSTVLESTLASIRAVGRTVSLAPLCDDIDTPEDLARLKKRIEPKSFTGQFLNKESEQL